MSYSDTHDNLCVLLEEYADADIETVATQILAMLGLTGEDLLESLDPPTGLVTWLRSHGLSLVTVTEARSPRVWDALEEEDEDGDEEESLEGGPSEELPLQAGENVEYRTVPRGPNHSSEIGAGQIINVGENGFIWVRVLGRPDVLIIPEEGDIIRRT